ncbi:hypothetical protein ACIQTX_05540 [Microbacterium sp. NPDC090281]|jgi:hypothetical protein|uniref:hypothetical protein n=1 Tax=Microbacterium sp. NPDC090281 TaxID=3364208 RepID=UPI000404DA6C
MDNGAIFYVLLFGPMLPLVVIIAAVVLFGVGFALHGLTGAVIRTIDETSRPHRERAYVRKHQRDITLL